MLYKQYLTLYIFVFMLISKSFQITYTSNSFKQSIEHIKNPDQGFYRPLIVYIKPNSFSHESNNPEQLYHLRCDISEFSGAVNSDRVDKKLTDFALNRLNLYLSEIKKENKNAIIRFTYDPNYDGNLDTEASMSMIETHIKQLSSILNKYKDILTAIEAGLLGPWGEMHTSKLATDKNKALIFKYWLENTNDIPILSRYPKAIFTYFGKTLNEMEHFTIEPNNPGYRIGLFNDCFLANEQDMGTYMIDRTREINWLATINDHLPFGGETCAVNYKSNLNICLNEMFLLRLSYLNIQYHTGVIDKWKNVYYDESLGSETLFYGMSGFDFIERHLGYRLLIKSIDVTYDKYGKYQMKIRMRNVGFGNLLKRKKVDIIFTDTNDKEISRSNVGTYKGENSIEFNGNFLSKGVSSKYKVYLSVYGSIENNKVYYPIQFANEKIYNNNLKAHLLFYVRNGEISES